MRATIISISPVPRRYTLPMFKKKEYFLPAAEPGSFEIVYVDDNVESVYIGENMPNVPRTWAGEQIATDLVEKWSLGNSFKGMPAGAHLGVWIAKGDLKGLSNKEAAARIVASKDYKDNITAQDLFCNGKVAEADGFWTREATKANVNEEHRACAKYLGLTDREWLDPIVRRHDFKKCHFCRKSIPEDSVKCQFCAEVVDRERYAELTKTSVKKLAAQSAA